MHLCSGPGHCPVISSILKTCFSLWKRHFGDCDGPESFHPRHPSGTRTSYKVIHHNIWFELCWKWEKEHLVLFSTRVILMNFKELYIICINIRRETFVKTELIIAREREMASMRKHPEVEVGVLLMAFLVLVVYSFTCCRPETLWRWSQDSWSPALVMCKSQPYQTLVTT